MTDWSFDAWPAIEPKWHDGAERTDPWDTMEHHLDLGCGTVKKARIGIDRYAAPGVNIVMDLDGLAVYGIAPEPGADAPVAGEYALSVGLPFADSSIESAISHHAMEHLDKGFLPLMDDIYRVLKPGGLLRVIVPLFPSYSAVSDPDHCRYFMEGTFDSFCGHLGSDDNPTGSWLDSFSVPYTKARFEKLDEQWTPRVEPDKHWSREDARELRVALRAVKDE